MRKSRRPAKDRNSFPKGGAPYDATRRKRSSASDRDPAKRFGAAPLLDGKRVCRGEPARAGGRARGRSHAGQKRGRPHDELPSNAASGRQPFRRERAGAGRTLQAAQRRPHRLLPRALRARRAAVRAARRRAALFRRPREPRSRLQRAHARARAFEPAFKRPEIHAGGRHGQRARQMRRALRSAQRSRHGLRHRAGAPRPRL